MSLRAFAAAFFCALKRNAWMSCLLIGRAPVEASPDLRQTPMLISNFKDAGDLGLVALDGRDDRPADQVRDVGRDQDVQRAAASRSKRKAEVNGGVDGGEGNRSAAAYACALVSAASFHDDSPAPGVCQGAQNRANWRRGVTPVDDARIGLDPVGFSGPQLH
jgi:hypothetical protein